MALPEIVLPKIILPFDVPVLLHPLAVHFVVALPILVLTLELINLAMKKRAVGGVSFLLLVLTVFAAAAAYITGLTDGKEAHAALIDAGKAELLEHKLFGVYILLVSGLVLLLKVLAMTGTKILKALYILVLIVFVIAIFRQGKEGGELVYKYGANVAQVKELNEKMVDLKDDLADAEEENEKTISIPEASEKVSKSESNVTDTIEEKVLSVESTPKQAVTKEIKTEAAEAVVPSESNATTISLDSNISSGQ